MGHQFGPQRLTGMRRSNHQRLALEVQLLVLLGIDPGGHPLFFSFSSFSYVFDSSFCAHSSSPFDRKPICSRTSSLKSFSPQRTQGTQSKSKKVLFVLKPERS